MKFKYVVEFGVIQIAYTPEGCELSKAGAFQSQPIQEKPYIGIEDPCSPDLSGQGSSMKPAA